MMPAWTQWIVIIAASASMAAVLTVGVDIVRYRARRRRQARTFGREAENTREGVAAPHAAVEPPAACPSDMGKTHTGAGASGGKATGSGVNPAGRRMMPAPQRCIRCRLYHLHVGSLLCDAEREATSNVQSSATSGPGDAQ